jgi:hypothetical protein
LVLAGAKELIFRLASASFRFGVGRPFEAEDSELSSDMNSPRVIDTCTL